MVLQQAQLCLISAYFCLLVQCVHHQVALCTLQVVGGASPFLLTWVLATQFLLQIIHSQWLTTVCMY